MCVFVLSSSCLSPVCNAIAIPPFLSNNLLNHIWLNQDTTRYTLFPLSLVFCTIFQHLLCFNSIFISSFLLQLLYHMVLKLQPSFASRQHDFPFFSFIKFSCMDFFFFFIVSFQNPWNEPAQSTLYTEREVELKC